MRETWGRHDHPEEAVGRILDAAAQLSLTRGFELSTMADVADAAGCSRATLYNYFPRKQELRAALRNRAALEIAAAAAEHAAAIADPLDRVTEAMMFSIRQVRTTPALAVWFRAENIVLTNELAHSSEVIDSIAVGFARGLGDDHTGVARLRARMIVRTIISFLSTPEADEADERALIGALIAPALVDGPGLKPRSYDLS